MSEHRGIIELAWIALARWLSHRLPRKVVYFALIRARDNATSGMWADDDPKFITASEVISKWHASMEWAGEQKDE